MKKIEKKRVIRMNDVPIPFVDITYIQSVCSDTFSHSDKEIIIEIRFNQTLIIKGIGIEFFFSFG